MPPTSAASNLPIKTVKTKDLSPSRILRHATPRLAFVGLANGDIAPTNQIRVRIKGAAGAILHLLVNGNSVPLGKVGMRTVLASRGVELWEYIGVDLRPGVNKLVAIAQDPFGNVRGRVAIRVRAPGALAGFRIVFPKHPVANATKPIAVTIEPVDASGIPILARIPVTLMTDRGSGKSKTSTRWKPASSSSFRVDMAYSNCFHLPIRAPRTSACKAAPRRRQPA